MTNRVLKTYRRGERCFLVQLDRDLFVYLNEKGDQVTIFDAKKKNWREKKK